LTDVNHKVMLKKIWMFIFIYTYQCHSKTTAAKWAAKPRHNWQKEQFVTVQYWVISTLMTTYVTSTNRSMLHYATTKKVFLINVW